MSYITTVSGKHFDPTAPEEFLLDITDIAHALSLICRGNGHTKFFYSVAQHSIACARESMQRNWPAATSLGCLLHDASEAYLSDVTRPVKKELTYYLEVEDRLQNLIWAHYLGRAVTEAEKRDIFEIDDEMLTMEFHQVMAEDIGTDYERLVRPLTCRCEVPEKVEAEFLQLFSELGGRRP